MKKRMLNKLKIAAGILGLVVLGLLIYGIVREARTKFGLLLSLLNI